LIRFISASVKSSQYDARSPFAAAWQAAMTPGKRASTVAWSPARIAIAIACPPE